MTDKNLAPEQSKEQGSVPNSTQTPIPHHKTTVRVMVIIIVMLLICIATRWGYVKKEVTDALNNRFKTEQKR